MQQRNQWLFVHVDAWQNRAHHRKTMYVWVGFVWGKFHFYRDVEKTMFDQISIGLAI